MFNQIAPELILAAAAFVFPLIWHAAQLLLARELEKLPSVAQVAIREVVSTAVHFVEQSHPKLHGEDKRVQAMAVIEHMLSERSLKVSPDSLSVLIEEAVFLMNQDKPAPTPAPIGFSK